MEGKIRNILSYCYAKLLIFVWAVKRLKQEHWERIIFFPFISISPSKRNFDLLSDGWREEVKIISVDDLRRVIEEEIPYPGAGVLTTVGDGWTPNVDNMFAGANKKEVPIAVLWCRERLNREFTGLILSKKRIACDFVIQISFCKQFWIYYPTISYIDIRYEEVSNT